MLAKNSVQTFSWVLSDKSGVRNLLSAVIDWDSEPAEEKEDQNDL